LPPSGSGNANTIAKSPNKNLLNNRFEHIAGFGADRTVIGKGAFGEVFLMRDTTNNNQLAAMKISPSRSQNEADIALREAQLLLHLAHPNIVRCLDVFLGMNYVGIALEYCEEGDLNAYVKKMKGASCDLKAKINLMTGILKGLHFLHNQRLLHRDIKPANILIAKNGTPKLADFGFAKNLDAGSSFAASFVGTPFFLAPEIMMQEPYERSADIYALGLCFIEIITLNPTFHEQLASRLNGPSFGMMMLKDPTRAENAVRALLDEVPGSSKIFLPLLISMLSARPRERPSIEQCFAALGAD
jgi:serine/threonine protein kinase